MTLLVMSLVLVTLLVSGCSSPATDDSAGPRTTASQLPLRPRELPLDGLDPCSLLTGVQRGQLGLGDPRPSTSSDEFNSLVCQWSRFPEEPRDLFLAGLLTRRDAAYFLGSTTGARVGAVDGFAAVETVSPGTLPDRNCALFVDVAAGQSLVVRYDYGGLTVPMTTTLACEKATAAAELMIQTLARGAAG